MPSEAVQEPTLGLSKCIIEQIIGQYTPFQGLKNYSNILYEYTCEPEEVQNQYRLQLLLYSFNIIFKTDALTLVRGKSKINIRGIKENIQKINNISIMLDDPLTTENKHHLQLECFRSTIGKVLFTGRVYSVRFDRYDRVPNCSPDLSQNILSKVGSKCASIKVHIYKAEDSVMKGMWFILNSESHAIDANPELGKVIQIYLAILDLLESRSELFPKLEDIIKGQSIIQQCIQQICPTLALIIGPRYTDSDVCELSKEKFKEIFN